MKVPEGYVRRFVLQRNEDVSGVSGLGVVAEGVLFSSDVAVLQWCGEWPTSVVWHQQGMASIDKIHGHQGRTQIVWLDDE